MNLLKANKLNSRSDVLPRGIFRLFWCAVGYVLSVTVLTAMGHPLSPNYHVIVVVLVISIPLVGMVFDRTRLRSK